MPRWHGHPARLFLGVCVGCGRLSRTWVMTVSTGMYICDIFYEMDPSRADETFLQNAGATVVDAIWAVDHEGRWLMQGWLFHSSLSDIDLLDCAILLIFVGGCRSFWSDPTRAKSCLSGIDHNSMMILDLNSEAGRFLWQAEISAGHASGAEAIEQNPMVYDLALEMARLPTSSWRFSYLGTSSSTQLSAWLQEAHPNAPARLESFIRVAQEMISAGDRLLATHEGFLLGRRLPAARSRAGGDGELADELELSAKNDITLLGPDGEIIDYACKTATGEMSVIHNTGSALFCRLEHQIILFNS
eukprot:scaffold172069_cov30-Prasinocladus_malaysianus.AAC.1